MKRLTTEFLVAAVAISTLLLLVAKLWTLEQGAPFREPPPLKEKDNE